MFHSSLTSLFARSCLCVSPVALLAAGCALGTPDFDNLTDQIGTTTQASETDDPLAPINPGIGVNTVTGNLAGYCVNAPQAHQLTEGGQGTWSLELVEDSSQLARSLNLAAEMSASWAIGGVDAKAEFVKKVSINSSSVSAVVKRVITNGSYSLPGGTTLKPDAAELLKRDPTAFRKRCGDGFINSYTTGGEYYGVVQIVATDSNEAQTIKATIRGSYGPASGSASVESTLSKATTSRRVRMEVFHRGGVGSSVIMPTSVDGMIQQARSFSVATAGRGGAKLSYTTAPYATLDVPAGARVIDATQASQNAREYAKLYERTVGRISVLEYTINNPHEFARFDAAPLRQELKEQIGLLNFVRNFIFAAEQDPSDANPDIPVFVKAVVDANTKVTLPSPVPRVTDDRVFAKWTEHGRTNGNLGVPTGKAPVNLGDGNYYWRFERGAVFVGAMTGVHAVYGQIAYRLFGPNDSNPIHARLFPVNDETGTPDGVGRYNHLADGGSIYWHPNYGAVWVHPQVRPVWAAQGWEQGCLGYPIQEPKMVGTWGGQAFSGGIISNDMLLGWRHKCN